MSHNHPGEYTKTELERDRRNGFQSGLVYQTRHPGSTLKLQTLSARHASCRSCLAFEAGWVASGAASK